MRIFCHFRDLHLLQGQVVAIWQAYNKDEVDLISASIATNAAIALAERIDYELMASMSPESMLKDLAPITSFGPATSHKDLVGIIWAIFTGQEAVHPKEAFSELGRYFYVDTALMLGKIRSALLSRSATRGETLSQVSENGSDSL